MGSKAIKGAQQSDENARGHACTDENSCDTDQTHQETRFSGFVLERKSSMDDDELPSFEISFQDLVIRGIVGSGPHGIVYSATFCDRAVAVKKLDKGLFLDAGAAKIEKFQQELSIIESLPSHPNIVSYVGFVAAPLSIVTEMGLGNLGSSLFHRNDSTHGVFDWKTRLSIATGVATGLAHLHNAGIVHGNIKVNNVLLHQAKTPRGETVLIAKLGDAGVHSIITKKSNPAYVSPELMQSGNASQASDVYALGVLLYELFAERPAYHDRDMTEVLRKMASDPSFRPALDTAIQSKGELHRTERHFVKLIRTCWDCDPLRRPNAKEATLLLSELVRMAIQPDYVPRSGFRIIEMQDSEGQAPLFSIPSDLYGRDIELQALKDNFSSANPPRCILVTGVSGVGKTTFVRRAFAELTKLLNSEQYSFHEGGFDRTTSGPYSGVLAAFRSTIATRILDPIQKNPKMARFWRSTLETALGRNAPLICNVFPQLEPVIGKDSNLNSEFVTDVPTEVQERFREAFSSFSRVLTGNKHRLTFFVDNIQWADRQSLKLLKTLTLSNPMLIVVLAYRVGDGDTAADTTLNPHITRFLSSLRHRVQVHMIRLVPPSINDMAKMCSDALKCVSVDEVFPLARLIYGRTGGGNPFYFHQFLSLLHQQHLLQWDPATESWKWDIEKIQHLPFSISDDLLGILLSKLNQISVRQQQILKLASCFGNIFSFDALALACETIEMDDDTRIGRISIHEINECVEHNLLVPYSYPSPSYNTNVSASTVSRSRGSNNASVTLYSFVHDRVHEAAQSLWRDWNAKHAPRVRKQIGYILKQLHLTPSTDSDSTSRSSSERAPSSTERIPNILFHIVSHINFGRLLISSRQELIELVQLNLFAAERAQAFSDFTKALEFVRIGIEILFERVSLYTLPQIAGGCNTATPLTAPSRSRIWDDESCVPLALQLLLMAQRLEYWFGTEKAGDRYFNEIRTFSRNPSITCQAFATKALQLEMDNKYAAAFSLLQKYIEEDSSLSPEYSMSLATPEKLNVLYFRIKDLLTRHKFRQISEAHWVNSQEHQGSPLLIIFLAMSTCGGFILPPLNQMYNLCKAMELVLDEVESRIAAATTVGELEVSSTSDLGSSSSIYGARIQPAMLTVFLRFAFSTVWRFEDFDFAIQITKACMTHPVTSTMPDFVLNYFVHICYWAEPEANLYKAFTEQSLPLAISSASRAYIAYHGAVLPSSVFQSNESIASVVKTLDNLKDFLLSQNLPTHIPNLKPVHALFLLQHIDRKREAEFFDILRLVQSRILPYISFTGTEFVSIVIWGFLNGEGGQMPPDIALRCSPQLLEIMTWEKLIELTSLAVVAGKLTIMPPMIAVRNYCLNIIARARMIARSPDLQESVRNEHITIMKRQLEQMEKWKNHMSFHAIAFYHFALAEVEQALNPNAHSDEIIPHYEAAIEFARKGHFLIHGALAAESLAMFMKNRNMPTERTRRFMLMARDLYSRLGADEKVRQLSAFSLLSEEAQGRLEAPLWTHDEESRAVRSVVSDPNQFPFWALDEAERNEQFRRRLERHFAEECRIECLMFLVKTREYSKSSDSKRKSAILEDITALFVGDQAPLEIIYFSPEFRARLGAVLKSERDLNSQLLNNTLIEAVHAVSTCTAASFRRLYHSPVLSSYLRTS